MPGADPSERYAAAERAWRSGDAAGALAQLEALVLDAPDRPNAHNLAGWILRTALRQTPDAMARAIAHFQAARVHTPGDPVPLCNLADAWLELGRDDEALAAMLDELARDPASIRAHNWLGWYRLERAGDAAAAVEHLRRATATGWFAPASMNLGLALERTGDLAGARAAYERAILGSDLHDPTLPRARLAAFARDRGHMRRALMGFREAAAFERERNGSRLAEIESAAETLEDTLARRGEYYPHARDEAGWIATSRAERPRIGDDPRRDVPTFSRMRELVTAARVELRDDDHPVLASTLERIDEIVDARRLPPRLAGVRLSCDAEAATSPRAQRAVAAVAHAWPRMHRWLWIRVLEREEPDEAEGLRSAIASAIARDDDDAAFAQLDALARRDFADLLGVVDLCEHAGDDAHLHGDDTLAQRWWDRALEIWRFHASCATSGAEGLGRMLDVDRVREKIAGR